MGMEHVDTRFSLPYLLSLGYSLKQKKIYKEKVADCIRVGQMVETLF